MKELIGKKIEALKINPEADLLVFITNEGPIAYEAMGECCSQSYFNDIIGVEAILGHVIQKAVEEDDVRDSINDKYEDVTQFYDWKLETNKGLCQIIYRNESNGYYGGYCELYRHKLPDDLLDITDDWDSGWRAPDA